jgi:hypothetical protein
LPHCVQFIDQSRLALAIFWRQLPLGLIVVRHWVFANNISARGLIGICHAKLSSDHFREFRIFKRKAQVGWQFAASQRQPLRNLAAGE